MRKHSKHQHRVAASAVVVMVVIRFALAAPVGLPDTGACVEWMMEIGEAINSCTGWSQNQ